MNIVFMKRHLASSRKCQKPYTVCSASYFNRISKRPRCLLRYVFIIGSITYRFSDLLITHDFLRVMFSGGVPDSLRLGRIAAPSAGQYNSSISSFLFGCERVLLRAGP